MDTKIKLNYNGLYRTECGFETDKYKGTRGYLRFYSSGKVLGSTIECGATTEDLKGWFNQDSEHLRIGVFKIKRSKIRFRTTSKYETVIYKDKIRDYALFKLKSTSLTK